MMVPNDPTYENPTADPAMVSELMAAMTLAIETASIPDVTTTADILSAIFTMLDHTLRVVRHGQSAEDLTYNTREINRVLTDMLFEFGSTSLGKAN